MAQGSDEGLDVEFKHSCDVCKEPFTLVDLADPRGVVRLNLIEGSESEVEGKVGRHWIIVGFGTGRAQLVVHERCLRRGTRVGRWTEDGE